MQFINIIIIIGYGLFVLTAAVWFMRFSTSSSDFIRGGGSMVWWMAGATAFMTQFSAWTFTGAAAKAYEDGLPILFIFWGNALGFFIASRYFAWRFRRLRVDTALEVIQQRFGSLSEYVFTVLQFFLSLISAAIWLNGLAFFVSAIFYIDFHMVIIAVGIVVILISVSGGAWTVSATNVVQLILLMSITMVSGGFALFKAGGINALIHDFPSDSIMGNQMNYWQLFALWVACVMINQSISINNTMSCYRFLVTKNEYEAKKAAHVTGFLFIIAPIMWFVPPWVSATLNVDLSLIYPNLEHANNASYLYFIEYHMPQGLLGLILVSMIAATIAPLATLLNRNAGIFVKNIYLPLFKYHISEKQQLRVGKYVTIANGILVVMTALLFSTIEKISFFNLMMLFGVLLQMPLSIPAILGIIFTRTPDWSGWATLLVGLLVSCFMAFVFDAEWLLFLFHSKTLNARELVDLTVIVTLLSQIVITGGFFMSTSIFYVEDESARTKVLARFRANLTQPIGLSEQAAIDASQGLFLARITQILGIAVGAMCLLPNYFIDRLVFIMIGLCIVVAGMCLRKI